MKITKETSIKDWYIRTYPTDELGEEMNEKITFEDLFIILDNGKSVYDSLGVLDSIIRERVFSKLAEIMQVDYDYIYYQWLNA